MHGDGTVDAKHGNLQFLPGPRIASQDHTIWSVPTGDHRAALLAEHISQFTVHPNLRVIIHNNLKNHGGTFHIKTGNLFRESQKKSVPVKGKSPMSTAFFEGFRRDDFPSAIVKVRSACIWNKVECVIRIAA